MPPTDRPRDLDALNRYWNDLVGGAPDAPPADLDPDLAAPVRRLQDLGTALPPAGARDRVRERLGLGAEQSHSGPVHGNLISLPVRPAHVNGHAPVDSAPWQTRQSGPRNVRRIWPLTELAAAVLLIVALGAAVTGYRNLPLIRDDDATAPGLVPMFRGGAARTGTGEGPGIDRAPGLLWTFRSESPGRPTFSIANGVLYVAGDNHALYAVDARTGVERWRFPTDGATSGVPAVSGGTVYVGTASGTLYAIDAKTGAERWHVATGGPICCSPAVVDDALYLGSGDGTFAAYDLATGAVRWSFHRDGVTWSSPAVAGGVVYAGDDAHTIHALDAVTGAERWSFKTLGSGVVPVPAVAGGTVYVTSWDGALYALSADTGAQRWLFVADGAVYSPAVANGTVYTGSMDGKIYAVDAATGQERWHYATESRVLAQPLLVGDTLYAGSIDGRIYALDAQTGALRWLVGIARIGFGPVLADGILYAAAADGRVLALADDPTASPLPSTPALTGCDCGLKTPWLR